MKQSDKKQAVSLISSLFCAIPDDWYGFTLMRDDLFSLNMKAERDHRSGHPSVKGFTVKDTAQYFTVKFLYDACKAVDGEQYLYTAQDLLGARYEAVRAQAYVMRKRGLFNNWKELVKNSDFESLDYAELMK